MEIYTNEIILGAFILVWFFICIFIYKICRSAALLAGATVASCLFFLGVTIALSFLVKGALLLSPVWLSILILLTIHMKAAWRKVGLEMSPSKPNHKDENANIPKTSQTISYI